MKWETIVWLVVIGVVTGLIIYWVTKKVEEPAKAPANQ